MMSVWAAVVGRSRSLPWVFPRFGGEGMRGYELLLSCLKHKLNPI